MKIKITEDIINKKYAKIITIKHSDSNVYGVVSIKLKKETKFQTFFL